MHLSHGHPPGILCQKELSAGHRGGTSVVSCRTRFSVFSGTILVGHKVRPILAWLGFAEGCLPQSPCQQSGHACRRAHFRTSGNRREMPDSPDELGLGGRLRVRKASTCKGVRLPRAGSQSSRAVRILGCLTGRRVCVQGRKIPEMPLAFCCTFHTAPSAILMAFLISMLSVRIWAPQGQASNGCAGSWRRGAAHIPLALQPAWDLDTPAVPHDRGS